MFITKKKKNECRWECVKLSRQFRFICRTQWSTDTHKHAHPERVGSHVAAMNAFDMSRDALCCSDANFVSLNFLLVFSSSAWISMKNEISSEWQHKRLAHFKIQSYHGSVAHSKQHYLNPAISRNVWPCGLCKHLIFFLVVFLLYFGRLNVSFAQRNFNPRTAL